MKKIFYNLCGNDVFQSCVVLLKKFFHIFLDIVLPKCCCLCCCANDNGLLCDKCSQSCYQIDQKNCCKQCGYPFQTNNNDGTNFLDKNKVFCPSCKSGKRYFDIARSCYQYKAQIKKSLKNFKFYFQTDILPLVGVSILQTYQTMFEADYICFIPITRLKLFQKGYNHSGLITLAFLQQLTTGKTPILLEDLLVKTKISQSSKTLSQNQRWLKKYNFDINKKYQTSQWKAQMDGKTILIIDDIMTTGATLNMASYTLKKYFPNIKIECITFARTMLY